MILKKDLKAMIVLILYKIILEITYIKVIVPIYGYSGFQNDFKISYYLFYWLIFLLFMKPVINLYSYEKPSSMIMLIFCMVAMIPGFVIQSFMPQSKLFVLCFISYWFFMLLFNQIIPSIKFKLKFQDSILIYIIALVFTVLVLYISGKYTNFRLNFNLLNVYELRDIATDFQMSTILSYGFSAAKVCLPIMFVFFIERKQIFISIIIAFVQFLAFSVDGSKSTLFSIVITYIIYKFIRTITVKNISSIIFLTSLIAILEPVIIKTNYIILFLIRRVFFIPNLLNFYYFDFFLQNKKDYFTQGILGRFGLASNYELPIPKIIGFNYFNSTEMIANNGLFSDAYYNMGIFGLLLLPLLLVLILKLLDGCAEGIQMNILIASIITTSYTFISSSFFTVLLTHGFLLTCLVLYLIPKKVKTNE
ncbi:hypothetical protein [Vagococcus sp.]|uniref:hypothetical protein n=1 Tax=Vagococcus sp. TaxID=1933889 RepID=UPI002FCAEA7D